MTPHISVGLTEVKSVKAEGNVKMVRLAIMSIGCGESDVAMTIQDARMVAALLITAADELQKQELVPSDGGLE